MHFLVDLYDNNSVGSNSKIVWLCGLLGFWQLWYGQYLPHMVLLKISLGIYFNWHMVLGTYATWYIWYFLLGTFSLRPLRIGYLVHLVLLTWHLVFGTYGCWYLWYLVHMVLGPYGMWYLIHMLLGRYGTSHLAHNMVLRPWNIWYFSLGTYCTSHLANILLGTYGTWCIWYLVHMLLGTYSTWYTWYLTHMVVHTWHTFYFIYGTYGTRTCNKENVSHIVERIFTPIILLLHFIVNNSNNFLTCIYNSEQFNVFTKNNK